MTQRSFRRNLVGSRGTVGASAVLFCWIVVLTAAGCGGGDDAPIIPSGPSTPSTGPLVFSDGTFVTTEWSQEEYISGPTGGSSSVAQRGSGGNPGAYREVVATKNATAGTGQSGGTTVYSFRPLATYRPGEEGAITTIDFSIDAKQNVMASGGSVTLALQQGGGRWAAPGSSSPGGRLAVEETTWTRKERAGLTQNDFSDPLRPGERPNFSASGGPITLGFAYGVSTVVDGGVSTRTADFDNWMVTIRRQ